MRRASELAPARRSQLAPRPGAGRHLQDPRRSSATPYILAIHAPSAFLAKLIARRDAPGRRSAGAPTSISPSCADLDPLDVEFGIPQVLDLYLSKSLDFGAPVQRAADEWRLANWNAGRDAAAGAAGPGSTGRTEPRVADRHGARSAQASQIIVFVGANEALLGRHRHRPIHASPGTRPPALHPCSKWPWRPRPRPAGAAGRPIRRTPVERGILRALFSLPSFVIEACRRVPRG